MRFAGPVQDQKPAAELDKARLRMESICHTFAMSFPFVPDSDEKRVLELAQDSLNQPVSSKILVAAHHIPGQSSIAADNAART